MREIPIDSLNELREQKDALDQSVALNHIVMAMLESKRREDFWLRIILIISIIINLAIACVFVQYEKGIVTTETVTTTTTEVDQNTGEGSGNNVYQAGEYANYIQGNSEEVTPNGETDNQNDYSNTNNNSDSRT